MLVKKGESVKQQMSYGSGILENVTYEDGTKSSSTYLQLWILAYLRYVHYRRRFHKRTRISASAKDQLSEEDQRREPRLIVEPDDPLYQRYTCWSLAADPLVSNLAYASA